MPVGVGSDTRVLRTKDIHQASPYQVLGKAFPLLLSCEVTTFSIAMPCILARLRRSLGKQAHFHCTMKTCNTHIESQYMQGWLIRQLFK